MNRHLRSFFIAVVLIIITVVAIPSFGSTIRPVHAADQQRVERAGDSTDEPQPTDAPAQPTDDATDVPATEQPTDVVPMEQPTDAPTDVPATEQPTDVAVTDQPTDEPTSVDATEEATVEPTATATDTPVDAEATATVTPEETLAPEETLLPEETLSPEVTETPTVIAPEFDIATSCKETGVTFVITNIGADMDSPSQFVLTLDDAANAAGPTAPSNLTASTFPVDFVLHAGESTDVEAGFGQPKLVLEGVLYQPDAPCLPPAPPVLTVSAICTFEKGVTFTISNSGGAMPAEQGFVIAVSNGGDPVSGTFQLATTETASFDAGYGQPIFSSGDLMGTIDTPCDAPTTISGTVWNDADGNSARDAAETGIAGMNVNLIDASGAVKTYMTGADGSYTFEQLHVGSYTVKVDASTLSTDYVLSYPSDSTVTVDATGTNTSADFGYSAKPTASVTGTVWLETTNYGVRDANEMGISGVVVDLVDHNGVVVAVASVDATTGTYVFTAVLAGEYMVRLDQSTLFTPNGVTYNSDSSFDYETHVTLATDQALTNVDFGLVGTY